MFSTTYALCSLRLLKFKTELQTFSIYVASIEFVSPAIQETEFSQHSLGHLCPKQWTESTATSRQTIKFSAMLRLAWG